MRSALEFLINVCVFYVFFKHKTAYEVRISDWSSDVCSSDLRANARLQEDMATCAKWKVPIVITSLGALEEVHQSVHGWGGITLHYVINDRFARKAVEKGANGLIAVAAGAGGHAGRLSPFALVHEIRAWFDGPLILSGAIATGRAILAAQAMGADLAYIGSPFLATEEANATPDYKNGIVDGKAGDIVYSSFFPGVHGNYPRRSIEAAALGRPSFKERVCHCAYISVV